MQNPKYGRQWGQGHKGSLCVYPNEIIIMPEKRQFQQGQVLGAWA